MNDLCRFAGVRALGLGMLLCTASAWAQDYPSKPIRIITPNAVGSVAEVQVRIIGAKLTERLGWTIVVENRPGADFTVGTMAVVQSPPDGYTLFESVSPQTALPAMRKDLPYDLLKDLTHITRTATSDVIIVAPVSVPANNLAELVAYTKANASKVNYATSVRLAMEQLRLRTGLAGTFVNYKSATASLPDLLSGALTYGLTGPANVLDLVKAGKLKPILLPQPHPNALFPGVQNSTDVGLPDLDASTWLGLSAPARTPRPVIERLHREVVAALQAPDLQQQFMKLGLVPVWDTPEQFTKMLERDIATNIRVVREANLKFD
jgi:tripartite-type tricarboxylate transporter receptor subunit TctC